jgi:hypothetical protein
MEVGGKIWVTLHSSSLMYKGITIHFRESYSNGTCTGRVLGIDLF